MKVFNKISSILDTIDNCTNIPALKKLEARLQNFLLLFFFCEFCSEKSQNVLTEDQAKKINKVASILIKKNIEGKVSYKFHRIIIILKLCSWNSETLTKMFKAVYAKVPETLSRLEKFLNYYKELKIENATTGIVFDTSSQHEQFVALAGAYYGFDGIEKVLQQTDFYKKKSGPQQVFLSKVALFLVSGKHFGESQSDLETLRELLKKEVLTDVKIENTTITCSHVNFTLIDLLRLKGYETVIQDKVQHERSFVPIDVDLLFKNAMLFSDNLLLQRVKSIQSVWNADLLKNCISYAIQCRMRETIEYLISFNPELIEKTKLISTATIKADSYELHLNDYQNLLNEYLRFVEKDYAYLDFLIKIFIKYNIFAINDPTPLLALCFSPSDQDVKHRVFDLIIEFGFDIFGQQKILQKSFISIICLREDHNFLIYVIANPSLNKKHSNLLARIFDLALGGFPKTVAFLKKTYPGKFDEVGNKEMIAPLASAVLEKNYKRLEKILKIAKKQNQDVDPAFTYPEIKSPVLISKKAKFFKRPLQMEGKLYLSPLYLAIIKNDIQAYKLLREAGARVIAPFTAHHPLTLAVFFNADKVIKALLQETEIKSYFEKDNEIIRKIFEISLMGMLFQEQYDYLSQFLAYPAFEKLKLPSRLYFLLIDCEFHDMKIFKKFWSDEYLKNEVFYTHLLINSEYEEFFQEMLALVITRLSKVPSILDDAIIKQEFNGLLIFVICTAAFCKTKLADLPEEDCQHLLKLLSVTHDATDQDLPSRVKVMPNQPISVKARVPRGDVARYLQLANELLSIIKKQQITISSTTTISRLNIFELICLGDFSSLLNETLEYEALATLCNHNEILDFSAMLGSENILKLLLNCFSFEGHVLKKALLSSINYNKIDAFEILLKALDDFYNKISSDKTGLKKYIKYIYKQVNPQQELIKSRLASYLEESEVKSIVTKQQQTAPLEITAEVGDDHPLKKPGYFTFKFFDENKKLCYAHIEKKYLEKTESLYQQIANVFLKNIQDRTIANGNIIPLGDNPKYGKGANKPAYKIRVWGSVSNHRGLLFPEENESKEEKVDEDNSKVDEARVYIAQFMPKHE